MSEVGKLFPEDYSDKFDELRQNRIQLSRMKYGPAKINFGEHLVDALKTHQLCIDKYLSTGNTEYLTDAANYLMFEFMYPTVKNAFFKATGSSESAGTVGVPVEIDRQKVDGYSTEWWMK